MKLKREKPWEYPLIYVYRKSWSQIGQNLVLTLILISILGYSPMRVQNRTNPQDVAMTSPQKNAHKINDDKKTPPHC